MKATDLKPLRIFGAVRKRPKRLPPTKAIVEPIAPNAAQVKYHRGHFRFIYNSPRDLDAIIERMEKLLNFEIERESWES